MSMEICVHAFEAVCRPVHELGMDVPTLLKSIAKAAKVKQTGLAKLVGVTQPQISRYLDGAEPKRGSYEKIMEAARRYGVMADDEDIRSEDVARTLDKPQKRMIRVKGYVGAGGMAHYYAVDPGDLGEIEGDASSTDQTVALIIIGTSLGKFFDRWHVVYDDVRSPVTDDLIGELCVVGLDDDRVLIKKIQRNGTRGFDLISNAESEPPIRNVKIEWAAKVKDLRRS